ncbi:Protein of unknown function DUF1643 [uncultured Caudovirales phage]|uniref:DUF1643 domain-containing protein n=1 Tax=uncultured Caudovirales phage TaxID=2100421 RepID=A0A6J5RAT2_9CAUD|nr:Protein of unknown function DUF1643 [uncultured Caudovirales phage]
MTPSLFPEPAESLQGYPATDVRRWIGGSLSGAVFDDTEKYRFSLWRRWIDECPVSRMVAFIALNPSTANAQKLDNTTKKCVRMAKSWGYDGFIMLNIFAWRDTKPKMMKLAAEPIGSGNDIVLATVAKSCGLLVCAWGTNGTHMDRHTSVRKFLAENLVQASCLEITKHGYPRHPLFCRDSSQPIPYSLQ